MDHESVCRLGLNHIKNIDTEASDEIYDPSTNNHIILLKLKKEIQIICPHCGLINACRPRSMVTQIIKHSSAIEDNIIIKLKRRVYLCECGKTFKEINPFTNTKKKLTFQKEFKILEALKDINKSFTDVAKSLMFLSPQYKIYSILELIYIVNHLLKFYVLMKFIPSTVDTINIAL
jgi:CDGSH-type Zn-finger protein